MLAGTVSCCPTLRTTCNQCSSPVGFYAIHLDSIFTDIASSVEANPLAESGDLSQGCFIRLESYQSFTIKNQRYVCEIAFFFGNYKLTDSFCHRILILVGLEILEEYGKPEKIGEPVPLEPVMTQAEQQQPSTATFHGGQPTPVATVQRRVAPRSGPRTARGPP